MGKFEKTKIDILFEQACKGIELLYGKRETRIEISHSDEGVRLSLGVSGCLLYNEKSDTVFQCFLEFHTFVKELLREQAEELEGFAGQMTELNDD